MKTNYFPKTLCELYIHIQYITFTNMLQLYQARATCPTLDTPEHPTFFFPCKKSTRPGKRWPSNSTFTNDLVSLSSGVFGVKPYKTWQNSEFWRHLGVTTDSSWWFQPVWKILVNLDLSPSRGENKKSLKPPPRIVASDCQWPLGPEACWHIFALNLHLQLLGEWTNFEVSKS